MDLYNIRNQLSQGKSIFDIPMRVTYYARVSTEKDEQLHSLSAQISYYSDFIKTNLNWTFAEGYVDEGLSGTSVNKRDAFMRMIDDARLGKFDFIVTKEISRFSRNTLDSIKYTQDLLRYGVGILFQSDNINTLFPDAELRLTIMSSIAQDEVRKISERVKFGFKRAIDNGIVLGNNKIWGYNKDNGKLVINEAEAEIVRIIFDMYANKKMGMRSICNHLTKQGYENSRGNSFSFSTIKGILSNPKYKGYYCGGKSHKYDYKINDRKYLDQTEWIMYKDEDNVPPIVSEELWDKANLILSKRSELQSADNKTSYQNKYKYSGKIVCMEHGVNYHRGLYKYKSGDKEMWRCKRYIESGKNGCTSPILYTSELDEIIKRIMDNIIINKAKIINDLVKIYSDILDESSIKIDIAKFQTEINQILRMKDKLLDLSIKGKLSDDEFEIRNTKFNNEIQELHAKIEDLKVQEIKNKEVSMSIESLRGLIANELDFSDGVDENIIDSIIDRIEVYKTENEKIISLKVYIKVLNESVDYIIKREKNNTSVCIGQYI